MNDQTRRLNLGEALQTAVNQLQAGQLALAEQNFRLLLQASPDLPQAVHFLGIAHWRAGRRAEGEAALRRSLELQPDNPVFLQNLGGLLRDTRQYEQALPLLERSLALNPDDRTALSNLCDVLWRLGRLDDARDHGRRSLQVKHQTALAGFSDQPLSVAELPPFVERDRAAHIIAFSLWGEDRYYIDGMHENLLLARYLYPEWTCRIYCDTSIAADDIARFKQAGAQVVQYSEPVRGQAGRLWRFLPATEPGVTHFLVRDADARLNARERVAVEAWLDSGKAFHVMRDHPIHSELILAGMWGGVGGLLPAMKAASEAWLAHDNGPWSDQHFLRERIWPLIHAHALVHDSQFGMEGSEDFPPYGRLPGELHVGGSVPRK